MTPDEQLAKWFAQCRQAKKMKEGEYLSDTELLAWMAMNVEKLVLKFKLPHIENISLVECLCAVGYRETGNKFSVAFNGSKGYLDNIEISCEGYQKADNRLTLYHLRNKNRSLKSVMVNIFYSDENGIRLSTGNDEPQIIVKEEKQVAKKTCAEASDDLPF